MSHSINQRFTSLAVFLVAGSLVGCGSSGPERPAVTEVSGRVEYNGSPVDNAVITFRNINHGRGASAITDASGQFRMTTFQAGDGVLPGTYQVSIAKYPATPTSYDASGDMDSPSYTGEDTGVTPPPLKKGQRPAAISRSRTPVSNSVLPARYEQITTSGLQVEVLAGEAIDDLAFELAD